MKKDFREKLLAKEKFIVTWELIPGRGAWESSQEKVLEQAEKAAKGNIVDAISLTDNPGGSVAIRPDIIGQEIAKFGIETIIHLTCKDKNRNQLESTLYALERAKLNNVLVLTGDYDLETKSGLPKPVFDLDSTQLLQMIQELNQGIVVKKAKGESRFKPCNFCAGAAVSPFKATEAELIMQYSKLKKKIENGAAFIITQVGYDIRKFHEMFLYTRQMGWDIPLIGNLYAVNFPTGRVMNNNRVPGCVVTDKLLAELEQERQNPDKGKQAMLDRTAKLYALLKGIGYRGVHLGGYNIEYEQIEYIVGKGEELSANWQDYIREFDFPQTNGFYFFEKDEATGLNTENTAAAEPSCQVDRPTTYKLSRVFHKLFFIPEKNLYGLMKKVATAIDGKKLEKPFHGLEHASKSLLYNCQDCGDCALTDIAYVCPMGDCPKNQRNGPCAGSYLGWCEVNPDKQCIWFRAYHRLKKYGEQAELNSYQVSPYNWKLQHTSSWLNFYLGRDHSASHLDSDRG